MIDLLTLREREITVLPAKSDMSKEVVAKLTICTKTAENHRTNLMRKPGCTMSQASSAMSSGKALRPQRRRLRLASPRAAPRKGACPAYSTPPSGWPW